MTKSGTVVCAAAHQHMDVRIVRVPVIDGDPVEPGAEIALDVGHKLAGEGAKIGHLGRVLRGHREPEMMPVVLAPLCEDLRVGVFRASVEHPRVRAVAGDALALEIGEVLCERRRAELLALVADDPGHDNDPPAGRARRQRQGGPPASPEGRAALGPAAPPEGLAGVAGLLRGAHHLADEALRAVGALVAMTDAAGADIEVVVAGSHA